MRIRIDFGVTSTSSSSLIYSRASSSESTVRGTMRALSSAGACVGKLFCFRNVHHEVVVMHVFADNLACVDLLARVDEELAAVLQFVD